MAVQDMYQDESVTQAPQEQASRRTGRGSKPARIQDAFGQHPQTKGLTFRYFCVEPGVGLSVPCGPLSTRDVA